MVVMIHHSWLSGTLLSEGHDIISISICKEYDKRRAPPNKPWDLGGLMELVRCGTGVDMGVTRAKSLRKRFVGILGHPSVCQQMRPELMQSLFVAL